MSDQLGRVTWYQVTWSRSIPQCKGEYKQIQQRDQTVKFQASQELRSIKSNFIVVGFWRGVNRFADRRIWP